MNKEKQIEEMAFNLIMATSPLGVKDLTKQFDYRTVATDLYELYGWRKASEVEKEIEDLKAIAEQYQKQFEEARTDVAREIGEVIQRMAEEYGGGVLFWKKMQKFATELKKKYTEGEE